MRLATREVWDRLGLVVGVSLTLSAAFFAPLALGAVVPGSVPVRLGLTALAAALILAPAFAGACYVAGLAYAHEEATYADFWRGVFLLRRPAVSLGLLQVSVLTVLTVSLWFYLQLRQPVGRVAALLCVDALLIWALIAQYQFPLLVFQEQGAFDEPDRPAQRGAIAASRRAFYLVLGTPLYALGALAIALLLTLLLNLTAAPLVLLWPASLAFLVTENTRELLIRYGVFPAAIAGEALPDIEWRLPRQEREGSAKGD